MATRTIEVEEEAWQKFRGLRQRDDETDANVFNRLVRQTPRPSVFNNEVEGADGSDALPVPGTPVSEILRLVRDPDWPGFEFTDEEEAFILSIDQPIETLDIEECGEEMD